MWPLMGGLEVTEALLDLGASPAPTPDGRLSPLAVAEGHGHDEVATLLRRRGATLVHPDAPPVSMLPPAAKWTDAAGWDAFYRHELHRAELNGWKDRCLKPSRERVIVGTFERRPPGEHVLVIANGLSLLPRVGAELGQHCTAIDLSSAAISFLEAYSADVLPPGRRRPGGSVSFVCGDLRVVELAPGPFSLIVSRRSLWGLVDPMLQEVIEAIDRRLEPGGQLLFVAGEDTSPEIANRFESLGFQIDPERRDRSRKMLLGDVASD